jgi:hypothetical protein
MRTSGLILVVFATLFFCSCSTEKQESLDGIWELASIQSKDSLGAWQQASWMKNGTGLLHYATNGHMSVHFWPDTLFTPKQEPYWYVAKYRLSLDTVFHTRVMHSIPTENLKTVPRLYRIKQDTLYLSAPDYGFKLTWIKKQ